MPVGTPPERWPAPRISRGDLQATFMFKGFDDVRRLGLRAATEAAVRTCCDGAACAFAAWLVVVRKALSPSNTPSQVIYHVAAKGGPSLRHMSALVRVVGRRCHSVHAFNDRWSRRSGAAGGSHAAAAHMWLAVTVLHLLTGGCGPAS